MGCCSSTPNTGEPPLPPQNTNPEPGPERVADLANFKFTNTVKIAEDTTDDEPEANPNLNVNLKKNYLSITFPTKNEMIFLIKPNQDIDPDDTNWETPVKTNSVCQQLLYWYSKIQSKPYLILIHSSTIYKYDIYKKSWTKIIDQLPHKLQSSKSFIDKKYNKLYMFSPWTFCVFDLNINKWNYIKQHDTKMSPSISNSKITTFIAVKYSTSTSTQPQSDNDNDNENDIFLVNDSKLITESSASRVGWNLEADNFECDPNLEEIMNQRIFHYKQADVKDQKYTSFRVNGGDIEFVNGVSFFRKDINKYLCKIVFVEEFNRIYYINLAWSAISIYYFDIANDIRSQWKQRKNMVHLDNKLKWDDWSNCDLMLVKNKVIVIINWGNRGIYCVDLIKGKMVKNRQSIFSGWNISMTAYDERNGKIYIAGHDTKSHIIFDVKKCVPLSLFSEEVVHGWIRMHIEDVYKITVPASLCDLVTKFLSL